MLIGLTGPSGAGKSTVASLFVEAGFRHIDCDKLVHALGKEPVYIQSIFNAFGSKMIKDGQVDRQNLGALVFHDSEALYKLNATVSPLISERLNKILSGVKEHNEDAILDAPLLFEYGLEKKCDFTIGVLAASSLRLSRLSARDGKTKEEIGLRLSHQQEESFYRTRCDFILINDGDLQKLNLSVSKLLGQIGIHLSTHITGDIL